MERILIEKNIKNIYLLKRLYWEVYEAFGKKNTIKVMIIQIQAI